MRSVLWFVMKRRILFSRRCAAAVMAVIMTMLAVLPVFADDESAMPAVEHAQAAILYNLENNRILYEYNASDTVYPTSTVKIMTAIVAMEHFEGALDTKITVTKAMLDEVSGNRIGFSQGEVVTVEQMLNCMLVNSANDAAIIKIADTTHKTTEKIVSRHASSLSSSAWDSPSSPNFCPIMIAVADPIAMNATLKTFANVCEILSDDTTDSPRTL
jgi:D-alanyl-D-alanine carboxypeptidase